MKRFTLAIFISLFCFSLTMAQSGKKWSLEDCIIYALENNVNIKQQMLNIERAKANVLQSKLDMLPSVNAYASHGYNWGQTIDRFTNQFATERTRSNNFYGSSSITVFNGFQKLNTLKRNQLNLLINKYNLDKFRDDVSLSIATFYLQVIYSREMLAIAQAQRDITDLQLKKTEKMVAAGTLARGDLLSLEAQFANEELDVIRAKNNLDLAYLDLVQLLDLPATEGFEIALPLIEVAEQDGGLLSPAAVYEFALTTQPQIKSAELNVESSFKNLAIARSGFSPSLSANGSWGTGYSGASLIGIDPITISGQPLGYTQSGETVYANDYSTYSDYETKSFKDQVEDNNNKTFTFQLNIPIFNGWIVRNNIANARINVKDAEYNLELSKLQLRKTIQQAWADARASLNAYEASKKNVAANEESFKYADQKFNVGLLSSIEYNEAKNRLLVARSQLLQSKFDYIFKSLVLDFYMGKPLHIGE